MRAVGLVRGINVGPTTSVSMRDLTAAFEATGFTAVTTLLRSGNVVFETDRAPDDGDAAEVQAQVRKRSHVDARVLLVVEHEFRAIAAANPLLGVATDHAKLQVAFVGIDVARLPLETPDADALAPEIVSLGQRAIYHWSPHGVSKSRLPPSFWRSVGTQVTARNWRTVQRILEELDARA